MDNFEPSSVTSATLYLKKKNYIFNCHMRLLDANNGVALLSKCSIYSLSFINILSVPRG